jgi:hypothetical protein
MNHAGRKKAGATDKERRMARLFSPSPGEESTSEEEEGLLTPVGAAQDLEEQVRREQADQGQARGQTEASRGRPGEGYGTDQLEAGSAPGTGGRVPGGGNLGKQKKENNARTAGGGGYPLGMWGSRAGGGGGGYTILPDTHGGKQ